VRCSSLSLAIFTCLVVFLDAQPSLACSVCYGEPSAPISQGVQAGVLVLLGVVITVLAGFASLLIFWIRNLRALEVLQLQAQPADLDR
jgi:hypothetical protein